MKLLPTELKHILFIENFLIPRIRGSIEASYNILTEKGISPEIAALESYQSGEILGLLTDGVDMGLYESFEIYYPIFAEKYKVD